MLAWLGGAAKLKKRRGSRPEPPNKRSRSNIPAPQVPPRTEAPKAAWCQTAQQQRKSAARPDPAMQPGAPQPAANGAAPVLLGDDNSGSPPAQAAAVFSSAHLVAASASYDLAMLSSFNPLLSGFATAANAPRGVVSTAHAATPAAPQPAAPAAAVRKPAAPGKDDAAPGGAMQACKPGSQASDDGSLERDGDGAQRGCCASGAPSPAAGNAPQAACAAAAGSHAPQAAGGFAHHESSSMGMTSFDLAFLGALPGTRHAA